MIEDNTNIDKEEYYFNISNQLDFYANINDEESYPSIEITDDFQNRIYLHIENNDDIVSSMSYVFCIDFTDINPKFDEVSYSFVKSSKERKWIQSIKKINPISVESILKTVIEQFNRINSMTRYEHIRDILDQNIISQSENNIIFTNNNDQFTLYFPQGQDNNPILSVSSNSCNNSCSIRPSGIILTHGLTPKTWDDNIFISFISLQVPSVTENNIGCKIMETSIKDSLIKNDIGLLSAKSLIESDNDVIMHSFIPRTYLSKVTIIDSQLTHGNIASVSKDVYENIIRVTGDEFPCIEIESSVGMITYCTISEIILEGVGIISLTESTKCNINAISGEDCTIKVVFLPMITSCHLLASKSSSETQKILRRYPVLTVGEIIAENYIVVKLLNDEKEISCGISSVLIGSELNVVFV